MATKQSPASAYGSLHSPVLQSLLHHLPPPGAAFLKWKSAHVIYQLILVGASFVFKVQIS